MWHVVTFLEEVDPTDDRQMSRAWLHLVHQQQVANWAPRHETDEINLGLEGSGDLPRSQLFVGQVG